MTQCQLHVHIHTFLSSGTFTTHDCTSGNGRKPHMASNSRSAITISGLWLESRYLSGAVSCSWAALFLSGWAWMDRALLTERTLRRNGSSPPNSLATRSPRAHWLSFNQSDNRVPARCLGYLMIDGPFLCVPIHNWRGPGREGRWRGEVERGGGDGRRRGEVEMRGGEGKWKWEVKRGGGDGRWEMEMGAEALPQRMFGSRQLQNRCHRMPSAYPPRSGSLSCPTHTSARLETARGTATSGLP